ncbi:hypothetical protein DFJ58DRAFT_890295 [Suillus subalutaceus]|uniref:uncharacterized protein n=1 Tax=Suillus subalutaceus TaxID=48586 RepID=UPI001B85BE59|nr:uncharacterized protein DFJ58DRAFT_890295 [Suillus subalutaceus]KAG1871723.1 hypothetical protein DFJ58DRAFT_890295 [Suillus subalutaceus]
MPPLMGNPNHAIASNFQLLEHQAAAILANLWHIQNEADKQAEAQRREEAKEEAQRQQMLREEQEAAIQEEHKKNKAKYTPIKDINVPSNPIILPCQYAVRKMKSGNYCELFYFTNSGLEEASRSTFTADEDALVMLPTSDGLNKWIPAAAARDPKAQIIKDENLTWEQFNEAAPHMNQHVHLLLVRAAEPQMGP